MPKISQGMKSMTSVKAAGPVQTPGCNWLSIGTRNINGRIRAMAIHSTDGNTVYAGTACGGVWVTRDARQSWKIGAVAVHLKDPSNPSGDTLICAGTGPDSM